MDIEINFLIQYCLYIFFYILCFLNILYVLNVFMCVCAYIYLSISAQFYKFYVDM